jgi:hypothetical protein
MDPTANLKEQLELAAAMQGTMDCKDYDEAVIRLVELVLALHGWISGGGFPPEQWKVKD